MTSKSSNKGFILLIIFCVIIALLGALYFFTQNEAVKNYQDDFKDKADKLKQQIIEKENTISQLIIHIERLKSFDKQIVCEAVKILKAAKLMAILILLSAWILAYALYSFNLWAIFSTAGTLLIGIYVAATVYFQNKVGDINRTLQLLQIYIITRQYKKYNFDPAKIYILEEKLLVERNELEQLKKTYLEFQSGKLG